MKIIKTVVEPIRGHLGSFVLSVAIESRPGCFKGYWLTFEHYPGEADAVTVANRGIKISDQQRAEITFGAMPSMEFDG